MKSPRSAVYTILIYSGMLGVVLIALSIMSLTAYNCGFNFEASSVTYMLYLMYYRAAQCFTRVDWGILDGINVNQNATRNGTQNATLEQPLMSEQSAAVYGTLTLSVIYLVLSIFLVIACIIALAGLRRTSKSKHLIFWMYFAPFIIIWLLIIIVDVSASIFYMIDFFRVLQVDGLMRLLEVENTEVIRPILQQVSFSTIAWPAMFMFAGSSKLLVLLAINIFIMCVFPSAAWQICRENQNIMITLNALQLQDPVKTIPSSPHSVDVVITPVAPDEDEIRDPPPYEPQPCYNPTYFTNSSRN